MHEREMDELASHLGSQLMQLLRWHSRQWWIGRAVDVFGSFIQQRFLVTSSGAALERPGPYSRFVSVSGGEQAIDLPVWSDAIRDFQEAREIPTEQLLLLDARYSAADVNRSGDLRRAILDAATACEVARDVAITRLWPTRRSSTRVRLGEVLPGSNLPKHLSDVMESFAGRNYAAEHPGDFMLVETLWEARGKIAHGREASRLNEEPGPSAGAKPAEADTQAQRVRELIAAADRCIAWLGGLV